MVVAIALVGAFQSKYLAYIHCASIAHVTRFDTFSHWKLDQVAIQSVFVGMIRDKRW